MTVNAVSNTSTAAETSANAITKASGTLDQNDFLKLLVAQMQFQDPLNPKSNTDMAAQMAQFTALQQSTEMSSSLSMLQANGLIGSNVKVQIDSNTSTSGLVTGVTMDKGVPMVTVGGTNYKVSQITSITPPVTTPATAAATNTGSTTTN